jgi:hypothetical protein
LVFVEVGVSVDVADGTDEGVGVLVLVRTGVGVADSVADSVGEVAVGEKEGAGVIKAVGVDEGV